MSPSERAAAVERIIKATGTEPDNRDQLAQDISKADADYDEAIYWQKAATKETRERLRSVSKLLKRASKLIEYDAFLSNIQSGITNCHAR
jgi:hypothetical protein